MYIFVQNYQCVVWQMERNHWLAERLEVSDITMSRWTINKIQPSMSQFVTISKILDVDIYDLIEDSLT